MAKTLSLRHTALALALSAMAALALDPGAAGLDAPGRWVREAVAQLREG
ncbi:MAG: hypothetical protein ACFCUS_01155 [Rubrimonas sp.]